jgi:hypothetical protein
VRNEKKAILFDSAVGLALGSGAFLVNGLFYKRTFLRDLGFEQDIVTFSPQELIQLGGFLTAAPIVLIFVIGMILSMLEKIISGKWHLFQIFSLSALWAVIGWVVLVVGTFFGGPSEDALDIIAVLLWVLGSISGVVFIVSLYRVNASMEKNSSLIICIEILSVLLYVGLMAFLLPKLFWVWISVAVGLCAFGIPGVILLVKSIKKNSTAKHKSSVSSSGIPNEVMVVVLLLAILLVVGSSAGLGAIDANNLEAGCGTYQTATVHGLDGDNHSIMWPKWLVRINDGAYYLRDLPNENGTINGFVIQDSRFDFVELGQVSSDKFPLGDCKKRFNFGLSFL